MKIKIAALTFLILSLSSLSGADLSDTYSLFSTTFGIDPNAGVNSFQLLSIMSDSTVKSVLDNPAATSLLKNTELTFHHTNWIHDVNIENILYASRIENMGFGFSGTLMYVPFTGVDEFGDRYSNDYSDKYATGYYWEGVGTANFSYNFFKNFYFDGVSFGGNIKFAYRNIPYAIAPNQSAFAFMGDIGILSRFNFLKMYHSRDKNFALEVILKNFGAEFIDNPDPLPSRFSAGLAYSPWRPLVLAFDFNLPFNLDGTRAELPYFSVDMDLALTSFLSIQSGFLLKSGLPRFSIGSALELKKIEFIIDYTLDLTTQFDSFDRISLEIKFDLGDYGRKEKEEQAEILYIEGLKLYAEGDFVEAIKKWEACLELNPVFSPAKEMIDTAFNSFQLQEEMLNKQSAG